MKACYNLRSGILTETESSPDEMQSSFFPQGCSAYMVGEKIGKIFHVDCLGPTMFQLKLSS